MSSAAFTIRTPEECERPAILAVICAAFGQEDEAHLVDTLWVAHAITHEFIAEADGVIIGYCAFSEVTAEPAMEGRLFGLAPVAVAPAQQNRGGGKALIERGLNACRTDDAALIVVLGEPEYYNRFGFQPASEYNVEWAAMNAASAFQLIDFNNVTSAISHKINYHPAFSEV